MEKDRSYMTENIFDLTLEILYLLTGEVMQNIIVPPTHSLKLKEESLHKILEVAYKMIELLTGEIRYAGDSGTLLITVKDEWPLASPAGSINENPPEICPSPLSFQNSTQEGHIISHHDQGGHLIDTQMQGEKELDDTSSIGSTEEVGLVKFMEEDTHAKISTDGSSNRNPPERCPHPLYSQNSTHEDHNYTPNYQSATMGDNSSVKKEYKEENEEYGGMEEFSEGHKHTMETPNNRNPPERCPCPLYSQDSAQEDHTIPHHDQSGDVSNSNSVKEEIKVEDEDFDVMEESSQGQKNMMEAQKTRNTPATCPRPLYSQDPTQENHTILYLDQGEEDNDNCGLKVGMMMKWLVEEDTPIGIGAEHRIKTSEGDFVVYADCPISDHSQENPKVPLEFPSIDRPLNTSSFGALHTVERQTDHSALKETHTREGAIVPGNETFPCSEEHISLDQGVLVSQETQTNQKIHSCPRCFKDFEQKQLLNNHKKSQKCQKRFLCSECGKSYQRRAKLLKHQRSHTKEETTCSVCGKCFLNKLERIAHQKSHKLEKRFSCSDCEKSFISKADLIRHHRSHTGEKPYSCSVCGKCYSQKYHLITHLRNHTGEKPYMCQECGKGFVRRSNLVEHQKCHTDEKPYQCSLCDKHFRQLSSLNYHMKCHSKKKPNMCPVCGKCYLSKAQLAKHIESHTECQMNFKKKPYMCQECGKGFVSKTNLVKHQKSHTDEKPYQCSLCDKHFRLLSSLNHHMKCHSKKEPNVCSVCGMCYLHKTELTKHMESHPESEFGSKKMLYICSVCGKSYLCTTELIKHMESHAKKGINSKKQPYFCSVCGTGYLYMTELTNHMESHPQSEIDSENRPHFCSVCGKNYLCKAELTKHMECHPDNEIDSRDKPYVCTVCRKCYLSNPKLSKHMKSHTKSKINSWYVNPATSQV